MNFLSNISIQNRLLLQVIFIFIGLGILTFKGLEQLSSTMLQNKSENTRFLVETAHNILVSNYQLEQQGSLTRAEAQEAAKIAVSKLRYDDTNYFWINDMHPNMVMHPIKPELDGTDISTNEDPNGTRLFVEMVNVVKKDGEGLVPYLWPKPGFDQPVEKISYVIGFEPWGWIIGSGVYLDDVDTAFWQAARTIIFIGTVIILSILGLTTLFTRSILGPINQTSHALHDITAGEGDLTKRLAIIGKDELATMSTGFNTFLDKMEHTIVEVKKAADHINGAAGQLNDIVESTQQTMNKQQHESQVVATAVTEMASTVKEVAQNAEGAALSADEANTESENGKKVVEQATQSVNTLATEVRQAASVIKELNADTQSISSVLEVIRGIAEQTNLLALNAAIEAARAGEQGRGFAVVADEVRTLAARTQSSTEEIRQMIESLQGGSGQAVNVMENGEKTTEVTVDKAREAGESLSRIVSAIGNITQMNIQIASAAEQQSAVANEIDRSIVLMADLTTESYDEIQKTVQSSKELSELSISLEKLVKQYKVSE